MKAFPVVHSCFSYRHLRLTEMVQSLRGSHCLLQKSWRNISRQESKITSMHGEITWPHPSLAWCVHRVLLSHNKLPGSTWFESKPGMTLWPVVSFEFSFPLSAPGRSRGLLAAETNLQVQQKWKGATVFFPALVSAVWTGQPDIPALWSTVTIVRHWCKMSPEIGCVAWWKKLLHFLSFFLC